MVDRLQGTPYRTGVGSLTIELLPQPAQDAFNERRWMELLDEPDLIRFEGRVETNRHGQIVMTPPPAPQHGMYQSEIGYLLRTLLASGRVLTECPISTADGVKAADVAWASAEVMEALAGRVLFARAPDVCIEVRSPSNSDAEMQEKARLCFDAGAREVWICSTSGAMTFWTRGLAPLPASQLVPGFPLQIVLS